MSLMVIVVPPFCSAGIRHEDQSELYEIVLGDCVYPGHVLQRCWTREDANDAAEIWSKRYGLRYYPVTDEVEAMMARNALVGTAVES